MGEFNHSDMEKFAFAMAHDMKAPLRTINSYTQLLAEKMEIHDDEESKRWRIYILNAVGKLFDRVQYILDYLKLSRYIPKIIEVDIEEFVHEVSEDLGIVDAIHVGKISRIAGDAILLYQLVENLLSNAYKYRDKRRPLCVQIWEETTDAFHILFVKDNGIGFSEKDGHRIFNFFERLEVCDDFPGEGVGLAICKRIVELHGGKIIARGCPNQGAEFQVFLPRH